MADAANVLSIFTRLLETNNPAKFTAKFTGKNREVLPLIFSIDKFVRINGLQDTNVKFRRIFNTMDPHFQDLFIEDQEQNAELTVELLVQWLIARFPPPPMKHEWLHKLKSIKMRKNEDPALVWSKFQTLKQRVNRAIEYINQGRDDNSKMKKLSKEQKVDALQAIFIRNNNCEKYDNQGAINAKLVNHLYSKNPETYQEWKNILDEIHDFIPKSFQSLKKYQFIAYPTNTSDYDIYKTSKQSKDNKSDQKTTKKESGRKRKRRQTFDNQNKRRKYTKYCTRCGRDNHHESKCKAVHNVFGKLINETTNNSNNNSNNGRYQNTTNNKHCNRCTRNNHWTKDCRARFYPDRKPINDGKTPPRSYQTTKNKGRSDSKNIDNASTKDLMALLTKRINDDNKLDSEQQFQCLSLLSNLNDNISARQDK